MSERTPLVMVKFTYQDGCTSTLSGPAAQAWLDDVDSQITNAWVHGGRMEFHPWEWGPGCKEHGTKKEACEMCKGWGKQRSLTIPWSGC